MGDVKVALGILCSCAAYQFSYFTQIVSLSLFFLFLLVGFDKRIMQVCENIMGLRLCEFFLKAP